MSAAGRSVVKKDKKGPGKLKRKGYEAELRGLQAELCHLQDWVRDTGARIIVVFEGRDAAGKGGVIKAITERVSSRVFRVVALPAPSDREKSQLYLQRYISHLLDHAYVQGDLFRLAAAYNAGPGNLAKWRRHLGDVEDPLLFIESLPSRETRNFIESVVANLWIYRARLGQPLPSLDAVAAGDWPAYTPLDRPVQSAARPASSGGKTSHVAE